VGVGDGAVLEVEDVLAEVPNVAGVVVRVEVVRDLVQAPAEIRDVLGDQRLDRLASPLDDRVSGSSVTSVRNGCPSTWPSISTDSWLEIGNSGLVTFAGSERVGIARSTRRLSAATCRSVTSGCSIVAGRVAGRSTATAPPSGSGMGCALVLVVEQELPTSAAAVRAGTTIPHFLAMTHLLASSDARRMTGPR